MERYRGISFRFNSSLPKTSSEVELMESFICGVTHASNVSPKTSSEVELMESDHLHIMIEITTT